MMKLLIRADDIGYCHGVNLGIADAAEGGLIRSAGLMANMPLAAEGIALLKDSGVCIGQHTNICYGKPCADPTLIPSMLDEEGNFHSSSYYRNAFKRNEDPLVLEEAIVEVKAQYERFKKLTGKEPAYFEAHALSCENLWKALKIVSEEYHLRYTDMNPLSSEAMFNGKKIHPCAMESMNSDYVPFETLKKAVHEADSNLPNIFVCHPGYVDEDLLNSSSLTFNREKEVKMLLDPKTKEWLSKNDVQLVSYDDIA